MTSPFLKMVSEKMWLQHYAKRTIESYLYWIKGYILFIDKQHPEQCHNIEVENYLSYLANQLNLAPRTQGLALNSLVFLYTHIIEKPLSLNLNFVKSHQNTKLPTVLTTEEVSKIFLNINANYLLLIQLMYGSGLRLMEAMRLRIQDIDFNYYFVSIWHSKGNKNRRVTLAKELTNALKKQIEYASNYYQADIRDPQYSGVYLPFALAKKYPDAPFQLSWHYLFPSRRLSTDPQTGEIRRHHICETNLRKAVKAAAHKANIDKHVTCHTLRHSFATHLLQRGTDIIPVIIQNARFRALERFQFEAR